MKRLQVVALAFCLVTLAACTGNTTDAETEVTAILGAFDIEIELLKMEVEAIRDTTLLGISFVQGLLGGRDVVIAEVGIGKTNAAMTTTLLIDHFGPSEVIFTGIAGGLSAELLPGDIVIGSRIAHHDAAYITADSTITMASWNPISGGRNPVLLPADEQLLALAGQAAEVAELKTITSGEEERTPKIVEGVIVTGDAFIASELKKDELRQRLQPAAVEMEGAAVAQVCHQMNVPWIVVRSISDMADSRSQEDMEKFARIAANNSATFVREMVELLSLEKSPPAHR